MHAFNRAITPSAYSRIENNEIMFNSGEGSAHQNPAAIFTGQIDDPKIYRTNIEIIGNKIHDQICDAGDWTVGNGNCHNLPSICFYSVSDSIIEDNEFYHLTAGFLTKGSYKNITVRNNIIHDVEEVGIEYYWTSSGFAGLIENNIIYNVDHYAIVLAAENDNTIIKGNTIINSKGIWNGWHSRVPAGENFIFKNNLFSNVNGIYSLYWNSETTTESNYNLFHNYANYFAATNPVYGGAGVGNIYYDTLTDWQLGTEQDQASIEANPEFISLDPSSPDFLRPADGSVACTAADDGGYVGAVACLAGPCSEGDIRECTTSQSCPGTQTCTAGLWEWNNKKLHYNTKLSRNTNLFKSNMGKL